MERVPPQHAEVLKQMEVDVGAVMGDGALDVMPTTTTTTARRGGAGGKKRNASTMTQAPGEAAIETEQAKRQKRLESMIQKTKQALVNAKIADADAPVAKTSAKPTTVAAAPPPPENDTTTADDLHPMDVDDSGDSVLSETAVKDVSFLLDHISGSGAETLREGFNECFLLCALRVYNSSIDTKVRQRLEMDQWRDGEKRITQSMEVFRMFVHRILVSMMQNINCSVYEQEEYERKHQVDPNKLDNVINYHQMQVLMSYLLWMMPEHENTQPPGKNNCEGCGNILRQSQANTLTFHRVDPRLAGKPIALAGTNEPDCTAVFALCDGCYRTISSWQFLANLYQNLSADCVKLREAYRQTCKNSGTEPKIGGFIAFVNSDAALGSNFQFARVLRCLTKVVTDLSQAIVPLVSEPNVRALRIAFDDVFEESDPRYNVDGRAAMRVDDKLRELIRQRKSGSVPENLQMLRNLSVTMRQREHAPSDVPQ